ncbi:MAG: glutamyl-tRNA reductase [Gemmatimonadales bacterium]|nr:glutamyl-tRNA reductase [Gemmatimonadales bacterium]
MPFVCIGLSHHSAPVALRELLAFGPAEQREFLAAASGETASAGLGELAILSTCNRTELYAAATDPTTAPTVLSRVLAAWRDVPAARLDAHLSARLGADAIRHLCRVAAGLDSMVIGESEVLGQVAAAHQLATRESTSGPVLDAAFRTAMRAGRRARSETGICRRPTGVSSEAVRLLSEVAGPLEGLAVLIVGTGKMGRLAGEALRAHGVRRISVVSRTSQHAEALASNWGATALAWHDLAAAIRAADAVLCSTAAPHAVVTRELVERAVGPGGDGRRRVFMDIAVPRDVEAAVREIPGVEVHDIDALQERLHDNLEMRRREIPAVERIVDEEVTRFEEWRRGVLLRPLLAQMHARSETIRLREIDRLTRRLGDVPPELLQQIELFSRSLVSKLLHEPTRRLREARSPDQARTYTAVTRQLFGLDQDDQAAGGSAA